MRRRRRPTRRTRTAQRAANGVKPPAALDEEWYVSIDGDQSGPFSLAEAQGWVAARAWDAELHCWSEGFDDWLPIEKVSHFRGARKKPVAAAADAAPAASRAPGAPRDRRAARATTRTSRSRCSAATMAVAREAAAPAADTDAAR